MTSVPANRVGKPRLLMLAPEMPSDSGGGLSMRCGLFLQAASEFGDVDVLIVSNQMRISAASAGFARGLARRLIVVESKGRDDSFLKILLHQAEVGQALPAFVAHGRPAMCLPLSGPVLHDAAKSVEGNRYDLCIVMRLRTLPVLGSVRKTAQIERIVCDLDDDDEQLSCDNAALAKSRGNETVAAFQTAEAGIYRQLRRDIAGIAGTLTLAGPLSVKRLAKEHGADSIRLIPNGIRIRPVSSPVDAPVLLFVGTLNYGPNAEGLTWFLERVLPMIRHAVPRVKVKVAGRASTEELRASIRRARVDLTEDVPDLEPLYRGAQIAIVPLLSGSGTRIKILEAGAFGLPVVATQKAAEGLGLVDSVHGWITGQNASEFAAACIAALGSKTQRTDRASVLRKHVVENHESASIIRRIKGLLVDAMG